jgi:pimeloyl-ACP methyl ester carboxylesterase
MLVMEHQADDRSRVWPFVAGCLAGAAGAVLAQSLMPRRALDTRLLKRERAAPAYPSTIVVPGILGSELLRPDGTQVWLNLRTAVGSYDLALPFRLPLSASRDDLIPGGLLGTDTVLPRLFGFTEYADLLDLLRDAGFPHHVFTYDWRRDLVESARRLHETIETLAGDDPDARFNLIGHSMGGLVARYYLRYGTAEPADDAPVTWAGARHIANLALVATPNGGSIPSLDTILNGSRVGLSNTTLAASAVARMPAIYQLLPPLGAAALIDPDCQPLNADLHDVATWERFGWGPFAPAARRESDVAEKNGSRDAHREFLAAALARAGAFHRALAKRPETLCPVRVVILGGDCLPTLARAVLADKRRAAPHFAPITRAQAAAMFEAGDGRVTRASVLAAHLPGAYENETGAGFSEAAHAFFGSADHHGIYSEPTFQSTLLRLLLRPLRPAPLMGPSASPSGTHPA